METPRAYESERDDIRAAVLRERELNEALSYLDRAISQFANQEAPSRWVASHAPPRRPAAPSRGLGSLLHRCVAVFGTGRRTESGFTALPTR
jgi:hypothetical protein